MNVNENSFDYFNRKHQSLSNDYKDEDGLYSEHCGLIALELSSLLIKEGYSPRVMLVSELIEENGFSHSRTLKPVAFQGRVTWGSHQICCVGDTVYDPVLEEPVALQTYSERMFGENISMKTLISESEIGVFLQRMCG